MPYNNSEYFDWFINEQWSDKHPECKQIIIPKRFGVGIRQFDTENCRGYTVIGGWRKTTNSPLEYKKNLFIYGGSTIDSREVPNKYTVASFLQRKINKEKDLNFRVNNRGFTSVTTNQQVQFLAKEKVNKGDIIVFFDGGNNQWQGVFNNSPNGTIINSNIRNYYIFKLKSKLSSMQFYKFLKFLKGSKEKQECLNLEIDTIDKRANLAFDYYLENLIKAKHIVESKDAIFIHFLQPHLFSISGNESSIYEKKLRNTSPSEMIPCGSEKILTNSSKIFSNRHHEILNAGINSIDLSKTFSKRNLERFTNEEYFIDWIHVTEAGNRIYSDKIFKILLNLKLELSKIN